MSRLLLDIMGGDYAPKAILDGALRALPELRYPLVLIGDEARIRKHKISKQNVTIVHASENIEMDDKIKAIRSKPNAPINVGTRLVAESWNAYRAGNGTPDAFVSAGHSGAVMASALLTLGRIKGIERPAIATWLPTVDGKGVVCLDVGANVDCKPEHLRDFGLMGALFASSAGYRGSPGIQNPKVAVLSNGEEKSKGNEVTRGAYALLEGHPLLTGVATPGMSAGPIGEFHGYCEAKEMFKGSIDVAVMDGFVGNLILKNSESLAMAVVKILVGEAKRNPLNLIGFLLAWAAFRALKKKIDFRETGAAPLLGVRGYVFIAHGRSDKLAIHNSLLRAQEALDSKMIDRIETAVASIAPQPTPNALPGGESPA
jgi:glycerol-3-phosphate acyltransferase PlsX